VLLSAMGAGGVGELGGNGVNREGVWGKGGNEEGDVGTTRPAAWMAWGAAGEQNVDVAGRRRGSLTFDFGRHMCLFMVEERRTDTPLRGDGFVVSLIRLSERRKPLLQEMER